jgi:glycine/D-amino acid oxidase-like deaminating enzyme
MDSMEHDRLGYWVREAGDVTSRPPLATDRDADLLIVGGGYTGMWTAWHAHKLAPEARIVLLESEPVCGRGPSGRNGGFCEASLTHGFGNGLSRWPDELEQLITMGRENLDGIERTVHEHGIDCDFVRAGSFAVATQDHQVAPLRQEYDETRAHGMTTTWLTGAELRARVDSPTFLAGMHDPDAAILEPARLAWGLRDACLRSGVRIAEQTPVTSLSRAGDGVAVHTEDGRVQGQRVVLATNAYPPLLRRLRLMTVPVYDYALMTEPLTPEQRAAIGWEGREGIGDSGNQFHYFRTTRDGRILWGGYDAIYHYASGIAAEYDERSETFEVLAEHFFTTFPQLSGLHFSHGWGGVIDTCTRFAAFYGTAMEDRVGYALGFTGLGVGATRFAGDVVLDLLAGQDTPRTRLEMVRKKPVPFPPEPLRWAGIEATRRSLARADANGGKENLWLRAMDRLGLGFDS